MIDRFVVSEDFALVLFRSVRWEDGVYCPECKSFNVQKRGQQSNSKRYSCSKHMKTKSVSQLAKEFNLRRNTVGSVV